MLRQLPAMLVKQPPTALEKMHLTSHQQLLPFPNAPSPPTETIPEPIPERQGDQNQDKII